MNIPEKYKISGALFKKYFFNIKTPLVVFWTITKRCNAKCIYCDCWRTFSKELTTKQVFRIIDDLSKHGTSRISITGGEPLLRSDIGDIINYIKKKNIFVSINSNGILIPREIKKIRKVNLIQLSFDGPKEVHNILRPEKTWDSVIDSMICCRREGIKFSINTTVVNQDFKDIDFILKKAEEFRCYVNFQPLINLPYASSNIDEFLPSKLHIGKIFEYILFLKKKSIRILNSTKSLKYFLSWPEGKRMKCWAGILYCVIGCEGLIYICSMMENRQPFEDCLQYGFSKAFNKLQHPVCTNCWCSSTLELNYIFSLNFSSIYNALKLNL